MLNEAYEILGDPEYTGRLLITCEHASNRLPQSLSPTAEDMKWLETHWGWDIGAAELARELVLIKDCLAVLAGFSRLLCDPNRALDDEGLIATQVEGHPLSFNGHLDDEELTWRIEDYWESFHNAVDEAMAARIARGGDVVLLSVHTFTPNMGGVARDMEVGVLFNEHEAVARRLANLLVQQGFLTALNEPYSGQGGLMYSANRHGQIHGVIALEIEVRQDLVDTPQKARMVARRLAPAITKLQVRSRHR